MGWFAWIGATLATLGSAWVIFRYLLVIKFRIDAKTFKALYEVIKLNSKKFIIEEEFIAESKYPIEFHIFCYFRNTPWFLLHHGERLLNAGWQGKDQTTHISCLRWNYNKLKLYLLKKTKDVQLQLGIPVEILTPHYTDMIGLLKSKPMQPLNDPYVWEDLEQECVEVFEEKRMKTGAILYGPPGNGKTNFIKYLATKYHVPIQIITLSPDYSNLDIMYIFSYIARKRIIVLEDFDNHFDGRKCILGSDNKSIKFTFDMILNGLDGVYNSYEHVVFFMTVNDIKKVDPALKNRPSRFKYIRKFDNPSITVRQKLLTQEWAKQSEGMNLDQIVRLKEFYDKGLCLEEAKHNLGSYSTEEVAYQIYQERVKLNLVGDAEQDWFKALENHSSFQEFM